jgi:hypothetical protein
LGIEEEATSIVCASLGFGAKISILCSLLNREPKEENIKTVALIRDAQRLAERNSFAHGFFLINPSTSEFELIKREVRDTYEAKIKKLDGKLMSKHANQFIEKVNELQAHASVSDADLWEYTKHVEAHALALASLGKPHPAPPTSSAKAKRK